MALDQGMEEIFEIFFEESCEGLDVMEAGLLGLNVGAADPEVVNDIFRAAHSIKGGAATFGFQAISEFTHGVETLLDEVRANERAVSVALVELQLACVDCLRGMLDDLRTTGEVNPERGAALKQAVEAMLATRDTPAAAPAGGAPEAAACRYRIDFAPARDLFAQGNDPARIFAALEALGTLTVTADVGALPDLPGLVPGECYVKWALELETRAGIEAIEEVFAWAEDCCALRIEALDPGTPAAGPAPPASPPDTAPATAPRRGQGKDSGSIRVGIDKVDALLNLVGELVIAQSMLKRCGDEYSPDNVNDLRDGLMELERYTRELQENAMQIRMLPISVSFSRFPRLVRDQSTRLGKKVELRFSGEGTELDKTVLEKMSDPLVHLVRNSLDHGIEAPEQRAAAGKSETGVLHLSASHEGGNIVIRVQDDGAGLNRDKIRAKAIERGVIADTDVLTDEQVNNLIFQPGFSTADQVSDLSGRGVGMDVVRRNILDLGGRIEVQSEPGRGSVFTIRLPLTLAILDGQLVRVDRNVYIFSLLSVLETVQASCKDVRPVVGGGRVFRLRDRFIPVVGLREAFALPAAATPPEQELLVIVESDGFQFGLFVDELLEQQQVVIKSLEENYRRVDGLAGATILGDGRVAMIIDIPGLLQSLLHSRTINFAAGAKPVAA